MRRYSYPIFVFFASFAPWRFNQFNRHNARNARHASTAGLCIIISLFVALAAPLSAQEPSCEPQTLLPGMWARVADGEPHNLRDAPGLAAERVGGIPADDIFLVMGDSVCADDYRWLPVLYAGTPGWIADAPSGKSWYEPLERQTLETIPMEGDPVGCARPPDDYRRFWIKDFAQINLRTLAMLDHAQMLYDAGGGMIDFRAAVMQGSYNEGYVEASFGTHDGGGAVDLSVRDLQTRMVLEREIQPALMAMRTAGFAAWLRSEDELYPGSVIHIHAIAVGDAEHSQAARAQVEGEFGYLRGYNGLPPEWGGPALDDLPRVVCGWMADVTPLALPTPGA